MSLNNSRVDVSRIPSPRYLTIAETVSITGLSLSTVRRALTVGALRHSRVGLGRGQVRIHPTDLEDFLAPRPVLAARAATTRPGGTP
ncbi:MAG: helix-turn-helix domain-containing protein [Cellulomonas sp.]